MDPNQLYESRKADWQALSDLLSRAEKEISRVSPQELNRLSQLYRAATSDLALAQRDFPRHPVSAYLNQLVARGHALVYRSEPLVWKRVREFIVSGFPRVYRELLPFTAFATLLFLLPALVALLAVYLHPDASYWLLPAQAQELRPMIEQGHLWTDIPVAERPYSSAFIMRNNIQVAFMAFGGGMLAGVLTGWILVMNGLILGGLTGLTAHYGLGFELWTFVIGHGVIELSVIMMAGGTGLMLGWSMLRPGLLTRQDSIRSAARRAVLLLLGCVPLLVIAGTIEGFLSPAQAVPWPVKWTVGLGSGVLLYSYLLLAGRAPKAKSQL